MDGPENPLIKYFSFIVLGLMLAVGYVLVRFFGGRKGRRDADGRSMEDILLEAEREVRRKKGVGGEDQPLGLTPEQQIERARVQALARQSAGDKDTDE